ncbi:murein L,D-transpeptidase catalytic domain family protein [Rudanella lutea]|uniref:murein L,D-transpeptidase catalytic domain family protein n=1 Tax=Rudanella lutea TaxID=451374 RepID=UPI00048A1A3B|nr:murein L,D-transpeptidase catalytic domain family protein [Rudanella lutea]
MKRIALLTLLCCSTVVLGRQPMTPRTASWSKLYDQLRLSKVGLSRVAFEYAMVGLLNMETRPTVISIADMSQPSTNKRLYVIDLAKQKLLFNTYVAHGRNSGDRLPRQFSNEISSNQSSLGFYKTMGSYHGKHGLSLKLKGLEPGINNNAFERTIVFHGADYVSEDTIRHTGRLGWSQGCPAVPNHMSTPIIKVIEGGSCLFIFSPDPRYLRQSSFLRG